MWDLPGPELEPVSPALAGGFLTTAPPGKSQAIIFDLQKLLQLNIVCLQFNTNEDLNGTYCKRSPFTLFVHGGGHLNKEQNTLLSPNCLFLRTGIIYGPGKTWGGASWLLFS